MLNYEIEPEALAARVPSGCELDDWCGRTFVSVVGFQFLDTRVCGVAIPRHRHFEEVNLRFYVRHKADGEWRRGVAFVKELVPRRAIATLARALYGENYAALPMRHRIEPGAVHYEWQRGAAWEGLSVEFSGDAAVPPDDAEETFIAEHYWGYVRRPGRSAIQYQVEHPRWRVWRADRATLRCDAASLYGPEFASALAAPPSSAFVADGSPIAVRWGTSLNR